MAPNCTRWRLIAHVNRPMWRTNYTAFVDAAACINPHVSGDHARISPRLRCRRGSSPTAWPPHPPHSQAQLANLRRLSHRFVARALAKGDIVRRVVPVHYRVGAASEAAVSRYGGRKTYSERIGSEASSVVGPNSLWRSRKRTQAFQRRIASSLPAGRRCSASPKSRSALTVQS